MKRFVALFALLSLSHSDCLQTTLHNTFSTASLTKTSNATIAHPKNKKTTNFPNMTQPGNMQNIASPLNKRNSQLIHIKKNKHTISPSSIFETPANRNLPKLEFYLPFPTPEENYQHTQHIVIDSNTHPVCERPIEFNISNENLEKFACTPPATIPEFATQSLYEDDNLISARNNIVFFSQKKMAIITQDFSPTKYHPHHQAQTHSYLFPNIQVQVLGYSPMSVPDSSFPQWYFVFEEHVGQTWIAGQHLQFQKSTEQISNKTNNAQYTKFWKQNKIYLDLVSKKNLLLPKQYHRQLNFPNHNVHVSGVDIRLRFDVTKWLSIPFALTKHNNIRWDTKNQRVVSSKHPFMHEFSFDAMISSPSMPKILPISGKSTQLINLFPKTSNLIPRQLDNHRKHDYLLMIHLPKHMGKQNKSITKRKNLKKLSRFMSLRIAEKAMQQGISITSNPMKQTMKSINIHLLDINVNKQSVTMTNGKDKPSTFKYPILKYWKCHSPRMVSTYPNIHWFFSKHTVDSNKEYVHKFIHITETASTQALTMIQKHRNTI